MGSLALALLLGQRPPLLGPVWEGRRTHAFCVCREPLPDGSARFFLSSRALRRRSNTTMTGPLLVCRESAPLSRPHCAKWSRPGGLGRGREDAIFFEGSSPAVYLINLYEIFLPKN